MRPVLLLTALFLALALARAQDPAPAAPDKPAAEAVVPADQDPTMPEFAEKEPEKLETYEELDDNQRPTIRYTYYLDANGRKIKHGLCTEWYPASEQKRRESTYRFGYLDGVQRWWHTNGRLWMEFKAVRGKRHGSFTEYRRNGRVKRRLRYHEGHLVEREVVKPTGQD